jgi:hypothetical protein
MAYRSWVELSIEGQPGAQLLLSFHGRGSDFAGVLVCLPVFQNIYYAVEDGGANVKQLISITDHPFDFYYTEREEEILPRFREWLEEMVALALSQYQRSL